MLQELLHGLIAQTTGTATQSGGDPASQGGLFNLLPFLAVGIVFYLLILRPQTQQAKKTQQLLTQLKKGDEVMLQNGFYAKIFEVRDQDFIVELAPSVKVRVLKSGVTGLAPQANASKAGDAKAEAEKKT